MKISFAAIATSISSAEMVCGCSERDPEVMTHNNSLIKRVEFNKIIVDATNLVSCGGCAVVAELTYNGTQITDNSISAHAKQTLVGEVLGVKVR